MLDVTMSKFANHSMLRIMIQITLTYNRFIKVSNLLKFGAVLSRFHFICYSDPPVCSKCIIKCSSVDCSTNWTGPSFRPNLCAGQI